MIYWNMYGYFTGVFRLPGFCGPNDAREYGGFQALSSEGPGDEATPVQACMC